MSTLDVVDVFGGWMGGVDKLGRCGGMGMVDWSTGGGVGVAAGVVASRVEVAG